MRTGVSYMGHHNPKHLRADLEEMKRLQLDDVLVAAQENDFVHFVGKIQFTPKIARDLGIRPIGILWGALNLFGGGRSSQFLLEHPEGFQVGADGSHRPSGCYVNPICVGRIKEMIDEMAELGFEGYFVDEPLPLRDCYCRFCRAKFEKSCGGDLASADAESQKRFREACVLDYVKDISDYCRANHPGLQTMCCFVPGTRHLWGRAAEIESLDNIGTDIYLANKDVNVEAMAPMVRELAAICMRRGKVHHEWLQGWNARRGREERILQQGKILLRERPDAIYVWAWHAQVGTTETCDDPELAWSKVVEVFTLAKA